MRLIGRARREERGVALVEFALIAPVLFLALVGLVDTGRAFQAYNTLSEIVRAAARDAAVHGSGATVQWGPAANSAGVDAAVRSRAVGLASTDLAVTSSWPAGNNAAGYPVVVSATYTFRPVAATLLGNITIPMSARTESRIFR